MESTANSLVKETKSARRKSFPTSVRPGSATVESSSVVSYEVASLDAEAGLDSKLTDEGAVNVWEPFEEFFCSSFISFCLYSQL